MSHSTSSKHFLASMLTLALTLFFGGSGLAAADSPLSTADEIRLGAAEIGLTPEAVVVSGLHEACSAMLQRLTAQSELCGTLAQQRETMILAATALAEAEAALSLNPQDQSLIQAHAAAIAAFQSAQQAVAGAREDLLDAVMTGITPQDQQRYAIYQQSEGRQVPAAFRVTLRTDGEWSAIEIALIAERRALRLGGELNGEQAQLLAQVRGELDVAAAQASLQSNLPGVQNLFSQTLQGQE